MEEKYGKRTNFDDADDLALLREAISKLPFVQPRGKAIADLLMDNKCIKNSKINGKKLQQRFNILVDKRRKFNSEAAILSGVEESYEEKDVLLDEIIAIIDDHHLKIQEKQEVQKEKEVKDENSALAVRELAMESLKEQKATPMKKKRMDSTLNEFVEMQKDELSWKKQKFLLEQQERQELRKIEQHEKEETRKIELLRITSEENKFNKLMEVLMMAQSKKE